MRKLLILKGTFCDENEEFEKSAQRYGNKEIEEETSWQRALNAERDRIDVIGRLCGW